MAAVVLMNKLLLNNMSLNNEYFDSVLGGCVPSPPFGTPEWNAYENFLRSINLENGSAYLKMDLLLTTSYLVNVSGRDYTEGTLYFNRTLHSVRCNSTTGTITIDGAGPYNVGDELTIDGFDFILQWIDPNCQYAVLKNKRPFHQCGALPSVPGYGKGIGGGRHIKYTFFAVKDGQLLRVTFICM